MRQSTIITLGASVAFGVFAVILARGWINYAIEDEYSRRAPITEQVKQVFEKTETVPVVVAKVDLGFGDVLTPEMLKVADFPVDAIPSGNYETLNSIFVDPSSPTVVLRHMAKNEAILNYKITGPGARGSLSSLIDEGMRAVSVRVTAVSGVSGFVMPGDYVDVIYTRNDNYDTSSKRLTSDVILQNIKILGVDQDLNDMKNTPDLVKTVTLEVSNVDAQKLHLAQDAGKLSLTLRPAGETSVDRQRTVKNSSLLGTPRRTVRRKQTTKKSPAVKKPESTLADVTVFRGETKKQVQVIKDPTSSDQGNTLAGG